MVQTYSIEMIYKKILKFQLQFRGIFEFELNWKGHEPSWKSFSLSHDSLDSSLLINTYKAVEGNRKGENYSNAHIFRKKIVVWSKPNLKNPNCPPIFHWADAVVVNYGYDAKNRTRNQQWVTPWGFSLLVVTFNASTHCWFPKLLQLHFLCAS